jgi:ribosomal protein L3 glutamine methyltransferase
MACLPEEYRREPELALASGEDGLDFTRIILREAGKHLEPDGVLIVEIGHNRDDLEAAFPETSFTWLSTSSGDQNVFMLRSADLARLTQELA